MRVFARDPVQSGKRFFGLRFDCVGARQLVQNHVVVHALGILFQVGFVDTDRIAGLGDADRLGHLVIGELLVQTGFELEIGETAQFVAGTAALGGDRNQIAEALDDLFAVDLERNLRLDLHVEFVQLADRLELDRLLEVADGRAEVAAPGTAGGQ